MNIDPVWIQAIFMIILVIITALYATFTYLSVRESKKSRDAIWKLEEKRIENKKMAIRRLIVEELITNQEILEQIYTYNWDTFKELEKIPGDTAYKSVMVDLGNLGKNEIKIITRLYQKLKEIGDEYKLIKDTSDPSMLTKSLLQLNEDISRSKELSVMLCNIYEKLFNFKIKEEKLEREIESLLKD